LKNLCPLLLFIPSLCFCQSSKDELLLTSADSLSIFELIDSLITMEPEKGASQLALRAGYSSNINALSGPIRLDEFGLSTKATYYHKSGAFIEAAGYLSNQYSPNYYLTIASLGYMNYNLNKWSLLIEYSRFFYHTEEEEIPVSVIYTYNDTYSSQSFRNAFSAAVFFQDKFFNFKLDYILLTGDRTGHRFSPLLFYSFEKSNWLGFDKICIYPTFSILWGIEQVPYYEKLYRNRLEAIYRIRNQLPLFEEKLKDEFGVMNYALRLPLTIREKKWSWTISYNYNFPQILPGETATIADGGNLTFSVVRYIELKR
jgi:hypothetical protein